jgi:lipase
VLAIHGITSSSRSWTAVARALGDEASVIAVDLRGRARSSDLPGPYGVDAHVEDMLAVLDHLGLDRAVVAGHSLGAYIAARFGSRHPARVRSVTLVDGGLRIPGTENVEPQKFLDAFLGPAIARLRMRFESRHAYRDWWWEHPAIAGSDISREDLAAYADHDLAGTAPELRCAVSEDAVRADGADLLAAGEYAAALRVPAALLCAPYGLQGGPPPMQPLELVSAWAAQAPGLRRAILVPEVNHYTIVLGAAGSNVVARQIREALADA